MDRFLAMGKLRCFSIFAKKNKVKNECPLFDADLHTFPCKMTNVIDHEDSIEGKAATDVPATEITSMVCSIGSVVDQHQLKSLKELSDQKDSMTVKVATALLTAEDTSKVRFSSGPIVDQDQTVSAVDLAKTHSKGLETDTDVISGPEVVEICSETPVEIAYEGGDEQEIHSSSRELSDHGSQRNMDDTGSSKAFKDINTSSSHALDLFHNSAENIFINDECDKPLSSEEIQAGHVSDPGVYKIVDSHLGSTSPVYKRSNSGSELEIRQLCKHDSGRRIPDNHSTCLVTSNSFEDLQHLADNQRGLHGIQSSPRSELTFCSADKVMLKRRSSSNVLPSRKRNSWWKIFLWSHRNLHKGEQTDQSSSLHKNKESCLAVNRKEGYSSDTLDICRNLHQTKQVRDPSKLKSVEDNLTLNAFSDELNSSKVHASKHMDWDLPPRAPASGSYSQWVAFSAEESNMRRVQEWVSSIDTAALSLKNGDALGAIEIAGDEGTSGGNHSVEISEASENLDTCVQGANLSNEMELANNVIRSLNAFSTVAHISGIGLSVIPALAAFASLRTINLSGNYIVRITPGSLPRTLHTLNLSRNKIATIEGLRELTRLRVLDLSYNKISRIGHGLATCTLIKELYLSGNKISDVEGLHRLLKLTVLDISFNKITTLKALGQLAANYSSLLALNLLGNPVHTNVGDEPIRKSLLSLLPHLAYLNKQPIKTVSAREAAIDSVAKAALGNGGRHSRNKLSRRGNNAPSSHRTAANLRRGNRSSEGASRSQGRPSKPIHDKGSSRQEHAHSKRASLASSSHHQKLKNKAIVAHQSNIHVSRSEGSLQDFKFESPPLH